MTSLSLSHFAQHATLAIWYDTENVCRTYTHQEEQTKYLQGQESWWISLMPFLPSSPFMIWWAKSNFMGLHAVLQLINIQKQFTPHPLKNCWISIERQNVTANRDVYITTISLVLSTFARNLAILIVNLQYWLWTCNIDCELAILIVNLQFWLWTCYGLIAQRITT